MKLQNCYMLLFGLLFYNMREWDGTLVWLWMDDWTVNNVYDNLEPITGMLTCTFADKLTLKEMCFELSVKENMNLILSGAAEVDLV